MTWTIEYHSDLQKKIAETDHNIRLSVHSFLQEHLVVLNDPRSIGANLGRYWRYRQNGLRIICDIQDEKHTIRVIEIGHLTKKSTARS